MLLRDDIVAHRQAETGVLTWRLSSEERLKQPVSDLLPSEKYCAAARARDGTCRPIASLMRVANERYGTVFTETAAHPPFRRTR